MAIPFMLPFFQKKKPAIDPVLEAQLRSRGKGAEADALIRGSEKAKTSNFMLEEFANKTAKPITTFTGGKPLSEAAGQALAAPMILKQQQESYAQRQLIDQKVVEKIRSDKTLSMTAKKRLMQSINYQSPEFMDDMEKSWGQTAKELYGDAARLSLTAAMGLKLGLRTAGASGHMISRAAVKSAQLQRAQALNLVRMSRLQQFDKMGKVGSVLKVAVNRGIPMTKIGMLGGMEEMAFSFSKGEGKEKNLKAFKRGFAFSVAATVGIEMLIRGSMAAGRAGKRVLSPVFSKIADKLDEAAFGIPKGLDAKLRQIDTHLAESVDIIGSKQYSEFPKDMLYQNADDLATKGDDLSTRLYHGTDEVFEAFDPAKSKDGLFGQAIYFSDNADEAKKFGKNLKEASLSSSARLADFSETKIYSRDEALSLLNDLGIDASGHRTLKLDQIEGSRLYNLITDKVELKDISKKLSDAGFDGVVARGLTGAKSPNQIALFSADKILPSSGIGIIDDKAILTPRLAQDRIKDVVGKINQDLPGINLGPKLASKIDVNNTNSFQIYEESQKAILEYMDTPAGRRSMRIASLADDEVAKTLAVIDQPKTMKQKLAQKALDIVEETKLLRTRWIDRFDSLDRAQRKLAVIKEEPLTESERFFRNAREAMPSAHAKAQYRLQELFGDADRGVVGTMSQYSEVEDLVKARAMKLDFIDRAKRGDIVPSGETLAELQAGLRRLEAGAAGFNPLVQKGVMDINAYNRRLLEDRLKAGLIDQELFDKLLATHPNYLPHNVVSKVDEDLFKALKIQDTMNVSATDIKRTIGGAFEDIADPFEQMVSSTRRAEILIERNNVLAGMVEAQEKYGMIDDMYRVTDVSQLGDDVPTISLFRNGKQEVWAVPKDVEIAIKGEAPMFQVPQWYKRIQNTFKKFTTQLNISFSLPNVARDRQTAGVTARIFIEDLAKQSGDPEVLRIAEMTADEIEELYKKSGGFGASIFEDGAPAAEQMDFLKKRGFWRELGNKVSPVEIVSNINEALEQSTRMAVFRQGLARGLSPKDAAFASRNATLDFARMGTQMKELNAAIPFLNARVQGFQNMITTAKLDPAVFSRMMYYTAVFPTMALHNWNSQFSSYANISKYYQDNYWNIITGEEDSVDKDGNPIKVPNFISIRKGEAQAVVANPINWFFNRMDGIDPRSTKAMILDTIGSASPVSFGGFDGSNPFSAIISQMGPIPSLVTGLATNKDPYRGSSIVPEKRIGASPELQFKKTTPAILKDLARITGIPAAKLEFAINSFGGVPQDITQIVNAIQGVSKGEGLRLNPLTDSTFGQFARAPILRRFFRQSDESGNPKDAAELEAAKEEERTLIDSQLKVYDQAGEVYTNLNKLPDNKARNQWIKEYEAKNGPISQEVKDKVKDLRKRSVSVEGISKADSANRRATKIHTRVLMMKQAGEPRERVNAFLEELKAKAILTPEVVQRIKQLNQAEATGPTIIEPVEGQQANVEKPKVSKYADIPAEAVVFRMPENLGGGEFATMPDGTPVILERDSSQRFEDIKKMIRNGTFDETSEEVDHIVSMALGGTNNVANLQALESPRSLWQMAWDVLTGDKTTTGERDITERQEGKLAVEILSIYLYRMGKVSLQQARGAVMNWNRSPELFLGLDKDIASDMLGDPETLNRMQASISGGAD